MDLKKNIIFLVILLVSSSVSALYLSDQGTGAADKVSGLPISGNLTVQLWDSISGGNLIYNYTFTDAIQNGSWNLIIGDSPGPDLNLSYGQIYYKDYQINGEDATFYDNSGSPVGRLKFQSPLGSINATLWITSLSIVTNETDPIWLSEKSNYYTKNETDNQIINYVNSLNLTNGTQGPPGENGTSVTITAVVNNGDGTYTWQFSDGYNFTTGNLTGPIGPQGIPGLNGADGINGTNGINGINGTNGIDGLNGTNGINGINGTDGINGTSVYFTNIQNNGDGTYTWFFSDGFNFTTGNLTGPQGTPGLNGIDGINGTNGIDGINGTNGIDGINGTNGINGTSVYISAVIDNLDGTYTWQFSDGYNFTTGNLTGPQGPPGIDGLNGTNGIDGINGTNGVDGINGTNGINGTSITLNAVIDNLDGTYTWQFSDGYNFTTGNLTGPMGPQGIPGINGTNGIDGVNGTNGIDGINGTNGVDGINGTNGIDGINGTNGLDGQSSNISVLNNGDGTYTLIFYYSNGTNYGNFTTNNLTGPQGIPGVNGVDGINGTNGVDGINGTNGVDGINGTSVYISNIIDNLDGTYTWQFSDGYNFTTGNLTGPMGPQGLQGIPGINGTNGIDGQNGTSFDVSGPYLYNNGSNTIFFNASALPNETDPIFVGSPSYVITSQNITDWGLAYSWGNHALAGYLTSVNTSGWDKNSSDDFNGSWNALSDIPAGFADAVDNDTQYNFIGPYLVIFGNDVSLNESALNYSIRNISTNRKITLNLNCTTVSGACTVISPNITYQITELIVTPTSPTNKYYFEMTEYPGGSMIDRNLIKHTGTWDIIKSYAINGATISNITGSTIDELMNIQIIYLTNG